MNRHRYPSQSVPTPPPSGFVSEFELQTVYPAAGSAFPSAEGPAKDASIGTGYTMWFVTSESANDIENVEASYMGVPVKSGSLSAALKDTVPRVIIPLVGGNVLHTGGIVVGNGQGYWAGQFLPQGLGLALKMRRTVAGGSDALVSIAGGQNHIFRYFKAYKGTGDWTIKEHTGFPLGFANTGGFSGAGNAIIDHCAVAWGADGNLDIAGSGDKFTVQHSTITPMIAHDLHADFAPSSPDDGFHPRPMLLFGNSGISEIHHNLFGQVRDGRTPSMTGYNTKQRSAINNVTVFTDFIGAIVPTGFNANGRIHGQFVKNYGENLSSPYGYVFYSGPNGGHVYYYLEDNVHDHGTTIRLGASPDHIPANQHELVSRIPEFAAIRETDALTARDEVGSWAGPSYVIDPLTGAIRDVRDPLQKNVQTWIRTNSFPGHFTADPNGAPYWLDYDPTLPSVAMTIADFFADYYEPWVAGHFAGLAPNAAADERTVLERYLDAWVPDFPQLSFGASWELV